MEDKENTQSSEEESEHTTVEDIKITGSNTNNKNNNNNIVLQTEPWNQVELKERADAFVSKTWKGNYMIESISVN